ncbi:MAG: HEPN domain-containing protein [Magnetococcales bacterium]|nr:HEPN domain-containing protein [Magnetococcales bacterium]
MSDEDHAHGLLELARADLRSLTGMGDLEIFSEAIFGFHAQQAIEKGLKVWLIILGANYPKTHDLRKLLAVLEEENMDVDAWWPLVEFNPYAVQLRYQWPGMEDAPLDRSDCITRIAEFLDHVESRFSR